MAEAQGVCRHFHVRLATVRQEIAPSTGSEGTFSKGVTDILNKFELFLGEFADKPLPKRAFNHRKLLGELRALHEELDRISKSDWEVQWKADQDEYFLRLEAALEGGEADKQSQAEAKTIVYMEMNRPQNDDRARAIPHELHDDLTIISSGPTVVPTLSELVQKLKNEDVISMETLKSLYRSTTSMSDAHSLKRAGACRVFARILQDDRSRSEQKLYAYGCLEHIYSHYDGITCPSDIIISAETVSTSIDLTRIVAAVSGSSEATSMEAVEIVTCIALAGAQGQDRLRETDLMSRLVGLLQSGSDCQVEKALVALQAMVRNNEANQSAFHAIGGVAVLVSLLTMGTEAQIVQANHLIAFVAHSIDSIRAAVAGSGAIKPLVALVQTGSDEMKDAAANAIGAIAEHEDVARAVSSVGGAVPLAAIIRHGNPKHKTGALRALHALPPSALANAGALGPLMELLYVGNEAQKHHALRIICRLSSLEPGAVNLLIEHLRIGSDDEKELVGFALAQLALSDEGCDAMLKTSVSKLLVELVQAGNNGQLAEHALKALLHLGGRDESVMALTKSSAIGPLVEVILETIEDLSDIAAQALRNLVSACDDWSVKAQLQSIGPLLELVTKGSREHCDLAMDILANIASTSRESQVGTPQATGNASIVELLRDGHSAQKVAACNALSALASTEENRLDIVHAGAIELLFGLMINGSLDEQRSATATLGRLAAQHENSAKDGETRNVTSTGGGGHSSRSRQNTQKSAVDTIARLVGILHSGSDNQVDEALKALQVLVRGNEGSKEALHGVGGVAIVVSFLTMGNDTQTLQATHLVAEIASSVDQNRVAIAAAGAVKPLVELVRIGTEDIKDAAAKALGVIARNDDIAMAIARAGGLVSLVELVHHGNQTQQNNAIAALTVLSRLSYCQAMIGNAGVDGLIKLYAIGMDTQKLGVLRVLSNISANPACVLPVVKADVVKLLDETLSVGNDEEMELATVALARLASDDEGRDAILRSSVIKSLVELVQTGTNGLLAKYAMEALLLLGASDESLLALTKGAAIGPLVQVILTGAESEIEAATQVLRSIIAVCEQWSERAQRQSITPLLLLLSNGDGECKDLAIKALACLATMSRENQVYITEANGVASIVEYLGDECSSETIAACDALTALASINENRVAIVEAGALGPLYRMFMSSCTEEYAAARAFGYLALHCANQVAIVRAGGLAPMVNLLQSPGEERVQVAAFARVMIDAACSEDRRSRDYDDVELLVTLGRIGGAALRQEAVENLQRRALQWETRPSVAQPSVIKLLAGIAKTEPPQVAANAMKTLDCFVVYNPFVVADADGVVHSLVELLGCGSDDVRKDTVRLLSILAEHRPNRLATAGAISPLALLLNSECEGQRQHAVVALTALADHDDTRTSVSEAFDSVFVVVDRLMKGTDREQWAASAALAILTVAENKGKSVYLARKDAIASVVKKLQKGTEAEKGTAARTLANLSDVTDAFENGVFALLCDAISPLIELLQSRVDEHRHRATDALGNLATDYNLAVRIVEAGALGRIVELLGSGDRRERESAAATVANVVEQAYSDDFDKIQARAVVPLIELLKSRDDGLFTPAARALGQLPTEEDDKLRQRIGDLVASLARHLRSDDEAKQERAARTLAMLSGGYSRGFWKSIMATARVTMPLIQLLRSDNNNLQAYAAQALANADRTDSNDDADDETARFFFAHSGSVSTTLELFESANIHHRKLAAQLIARFARDDATRSRFVSAIEQLVDWRVHGRPRQKRWAANALVHYWNINGEVNVAASLERAIEPLESLLRTGSDAEKVYISWKLAVVGDYAWAYECAGTVARQIDHDLRYYWWLALLKSHDDKVKEYAAEALRFVVSESNSDADMDVIAAVVKLLGDDNSRVQKSAARTLAAMRSQSNIGWCFVETNAMVRLVGLLRSDDSSVVSAVLKALDAFGEDRHLIGNADTTPLLANILRHGKPSQQCVAASVLENIGVVDDDADLVAQVATASAVALESREPYVIEAVMELLNAIATNRTVCRAIAAAGVLEKLPGNDSSQELLDKVREYCPALALITLNGHERHDKEDANTHQLFVCLTWGDPGRATEVLEAILGQLRSDASDIETVVAQHINVVAEVVACGSDHQCRLAVDILQILACDKTDHLSRILDSGVSGPLARRLQGDGDESLRQSIASLLLRLAHENVQAIVAAVDRPHLVQMCLNEALTSAAATHLLTAVARTVLHEPQDRALVDLILEKASETTANDLQQVYRRALSCLGTDEAVSCFPSQFFEEFAKLLEDGSKACTEQALSLVQHLSLDYVTMDETACIVHALVYLVRFRPEFSLANTVLNVWIKETALAKCLSMEQILSVGGRCKWARDALRQLRKPSPSALYVLACGLADLSDSDPSAIAETETAGPLAYAWLVLATAAERMATPVADADLARHLVNQAPKHHEASFLLCRLARYDVYHTTIVEAKGVAPIFGLVRNQQCVAEALQALAALATSSDGARTAIVDAKGIWPLIMLAKSTTEVESTRLAAAAVVTALASTRPALHMIDLLDGLDVIEMLAQKGTVHERIAARKILKPLYPARTNDGSFVN